MKQTLLLIVVLLALCSGAPALRGGEAEELYNEVALQGYRIQIVLHWHSGPRLTPEFRKNTARELRRLLERTVGPYWDAVQLVEPADIQDGAGEPTAAPTAPAPPANFDKQFSLFVSEEETWFRVRGREWDVTTQRWSQTADHTLAERAMIPGTLLRALQETFQPLFRIATVNGDQLEVIPKAAEVPPSDPGFAGWEAGSLARPAILYFDREHVLQQIQFLPLTYVHLDARDRGWQQARLVSAFRAPLGGQRRRRVELWALGGRPLADSSQVTLVRQDDASRVLMGQKVVVAPKTFIDEDERHAPATILSDRQGRLTLPAEDGTGVVWLYVWSGDSLLARVPFVPGWSALETLSLPDDTIRLRVEGELERLKGDLVENVARRAVLRAQALQAAKRGLADEARDFVSAIRQLPGRQELEREIGLVRTGGVKDAKAKNNRLAVLRVEAACRELSEVVAQYLAEDRLREVSEEVEALLKLADIDRSKTGN